MEKKHSYIWIAPDGEIRKIFYNSQAELKMIRERPGLMYYKQLVRSETLKQLRTHALEELVKHQLVSKTKLFSNLPKNKVGTPNLSRLKFLLVILPKASREEFIADLHEVILEMKSQRCYKLYIAFIVLLQFTSVAFHAFFFKLKGYFYSNAQHSGRD